jgi:predicted metal-dependent hydrolase
MIDWLRRSPRAEPAIDLAGRAVPVALRRLAHARRMTLRLAPDGSEVRISLPTWGRTEDALAFARSRAAWLEGQLQRLPPPEAIRPGALVRYRGQDLILAWAPGAARRPLLTENTITFGGPVESLERRLRTWLQAEARRLLAADLAEYAARAGQSTPPLALSNARRRWGSCSAAGTIRINWRLVMAPDAVRRSVVAHEVAHLLHFDHSPRFHAALADLFEGDLDAANHWLKREGRMLHAAFA